MYAAVTSFATCPSYIYFEVRIIYGQLPYKNIEKKEHTSYVVAAHPWAANINQPKIMADTAR